jgi:hypothetical protein
MLSFLAGAPSANHGIATPYGTATFGISLPLQQSSPAILIPDVNIQLSPSYSEHVLCSYLETMVRMSPLQSFPWRSCHRTMKPRSSARA